MAGPWAGGNRGGRATGQIGARKEVPGRTVKGRLESKDIATRQESVWGDK